MKNLQKAREVPVPPIPPARIDFLPEDRKWIAARIEEVLETGELTLGKYGREFERAFAEYCGVTHAIAVNNGTSALEIILRTMDIVGQEVLVPANTFFATAAAVAHAGGRAVLFDIDPLTLSPSVEDLERRIGANTAAIVVVHIGGIIGRNMDDLRALARAKGIALIEDAAHAHGSSLGGKRAGTFGHAASFSFYPTKVMTSAEGGMIVTNDDELARSARILRDQGKASFHENSHIKLGSNWRLSEPHAIIGVRHLLRLPAMIEARQRIAAIYDKALKSSNSLQPLSPGKSGVSNGYKYMVRLRSKIDRAGLKATLKEQYGVSLSGEVYHAPLHHQPIFRDMNTSGLEGAEEFCATHICLPVFASMTDEQAHHAVDALLTCVE